LDGKFYGKYDIIGVGDPYIKITFNNNSQKTKTVINKKTPVYNEGFFFLLEYLFVLLL
jgi:Ca2+-dependent lipid-binding protein